MRAEEVGAAASQVAALPRGARGAARTPARVSAPPGLVADGRDMARSFSRAGSRYS